MHNGMIIAEVTKRAKATFASKPIETIYDDHWIDTGKLWASELRAEGLEETAKTVEKHIEWFERQLNEPR